MTSPMVDCRNLIEFCKAYAENMHGSKPPNSSATHNNRYNSNKKQSSFNSLYDPSLCTPFPFVAIDIAILLVVLGAVGVLTFPYIQLVFREASDALPAIGSIAGDVVCSAPMAYAAGFIMVVAILFGLWELFHHQWRKCGKPHCRGLRKAVEFDIQLESEECVKCLPSLPKIGVQPLEEKQARELEAELKRMAPLNGRTVLTFRARCGCPLGRMEVYGPKKIRRVKK